jgi:predicted DNA binding CopG/RHH family protein
MTKTKKMTAAEFDRRFDRRFDNGEDISEFMDWKSATRPGHAKKRVNVDIPKWMIGKLDRVASRHGIARQALIKSWLVEKLKVEA